MNIPCSPRVLETLDFAETAPEVQGAWLVEGLFTVVQVPVLLCVL